MFSNINDTRGRYFLGNGSCAMPLEAPRSCTNVNALLSTDKYVFPLHFRKFLSWSAIN